MMIEKGIRCGICHAIYRYSKTNNKYMKNYNKNIELSYIMYLDANNLHGWAMFQTLPVNGFKWKKYVSKFDEEFIKNYDEDNNKGYILEVDVKYPKDLQTLQSDLPSDLHRYPYQKEWKVKKCNKLVCYLFDKKKNVVHIRALKQALNPLNHALMLKTYIE